MERLTPKDLVETINMPQGCDMTKFMVYAQRLWEWENMLERRELLKLPCKIGDTVYAVKEHHDNYYVEATKTTGFEIGNDVIKILSKIPEFPISLCGTYLTLEAAEAKLKELREQGK